MTALGITSMGLTGVVRMNWVQDDLAHVLEHAHTDETSGTWTNQPRESSTSRPPGLPPSAHHNHFGSRSDRRADPDLTV